MIQVSNAYAPLEERRPVVFFDGGCPLCSREIDHYRRLDRNDRLDWVDITHDGGRLREHGLGFDEAMARFHVLDADGNWRTGVAGFLEIWFRLPWWRGLARLVSVLRLEPPLEWAYVRFARRRNRQRCSQGACEHPPRSS